MSEINFACSLGNPQIRMIIRKYVNEIEWKSGLAQVVINFFNQDRNLSTTPDISELRTFLSNYCITEEVESTIVKIQDFINTPNSRIDNIVRDFETFYLNRKVSKILDDSGGDATKIINKIDVIERINTNITKVEVVGDLDVDEVLKNEMGASGIIPTNFDFIRRATPWQGYLRGQVVQICAPPGTIKSLFLANECVAALREDAQVYWVALGDMFLMDFIIRLTTIITGENFYDVSISPKKYFSDEVRRLTKNLRVSVRPAATIDIKAVHDLIEAKVNQEKNIDVFMLDYDSNLAKMHESMYEAGDINYNTLSSIARPDNSPYRLVFVASQPKIHYWELEELPKESAGESSRKQAIVDIMITAGKCHSIRSNHAGIIKAAKVRRGRENEKSHYRLASCGRIEEIDQKEYHMMKTY